MLTDVERLRDRDTGRPKLKPKGKRWYSDKEKLEAVKLYMLIGSQRAVAASLNIHYMTIQNWYHSDWWKDLVQQLKNENNIQLTGKLKRIADKALEITEDRLTNGDWIYDQKTGEMKRKPVLAKDASKIAMDLLERSQKVEAIQVQDKSQEAVVGRLDQLAEAFRSMAGKTTRVEVISDESTPDHRITVEQVTDVALP